MNTRHWRVTSAERIFTSSVRDEYEIKVLAENGQDVSCISRLIDAAPELLAACKALLIAVKKMDDDLTAMGKGRDLSSLPGMYGADLIGFSEVAIAKAAGR